MRKLTFCAALIASLSAGALAFAGGPGSMAGEYASGECDVCDECACGHQGLFGRRRNAEAGFNCGCNGSYKYPVPPLYTYHWPGMYSAQLMTDYHSPWRFPPLKPYTDESPIEIQTSLKSLRRIQPISATINERPARSSSFADRVEASLR